MRSQQHLALAAVLSALIASGCAVTSTPPLKAYDGPERPASELALLDWSGCSPFCVFEIDGKEVPKHALFVTGRWPVTSVWLEPGRHWIMYGGSFGYTGNLYIRRSVTFRKCANIELRPGAHYAVLYTRRRGWEIGNFRDYLWIQDKASGLIVAGESPASPAPARSADVKC